MPGLMIAGTITFTGVVIWLSNWMGGGGMMPQG